jgi:TP901 family phage tail tape measure protein
MVQNPLGGGRDPAVTVGVAADTSEFGGAMDNAISKLGTFKGLVATTSGILGGLAVGGLAAAAKEASNFESSLADVAKVTSQDTAAALEDDLMRMSENIPVARGELTKLAEQAGKFGVEGEDAIAGFVETTGKMATAMDLPADELGRRMAKIAQATDTPISQISKLGNATNKLADTMKTDSSEITDTAQRAGIALSNRLGMGADKVLALSASMNEVSPTARRAAGALRKMTASLMDPKKSEDLAAGLGMSVEQFEAMRENSPQELMNEIARTIGEDTEQADKLASALGKRGVEAFSRYREAIGSTEKAQKTVNKQFKEQSSLQRELSIRTNTFQGQVTLLQNKLSNLGAEIGQQLLPAFKGVISGAIIPAIDAFSDFNEETDGVAGAAGLVATAIGGLGTSAALVASQLGIAASASTALGSALAVLTGPVGWVAAAVVALGAAWTTNFLGIRDVTMDVFEDVRSVIEGTISYLDETLITPYVDKVSAVWSDHGDEIQAETDETMDHIQNVIDDTLGAIESGIIEPFVGASTAFWNEFGDEITWAVETAFDTITEVASVALDVLLQTVNIGLNLIQGDFDEAWAGITSLVSDGVSAAVSTVKSGINSIATFVSSIGKDDIKSAYQTVGSAIRDVFLTYFKIQGKIWGIIGRFAGNLATYVVSGKFGSDVVGAFTTLGGAILSSWIAVFKVGGDIWSSLTGFASNVENYVSSGQGYADITGAFDTLVGAIAAAYEGLWTGLTGSEGTIPSMFGDMADYVTETGSQILTDAFGGAIDDVEDAISYLTGSGEGTFQGDVVSTFNDVEQDIRNAFPYLTGSGEGTLIGDIKDGVEYLTGSGRGTLVADVKNGLDYLLSTDDNSLASDLATALEGVGSRVGSSMKESINDALGLPFEHTIGRVEVKGQEVFEGQTISIPALATGGLVEESGLAFVDEGEVFSGVPGAPGAEVDRSGGMMISKGEIQDAVASGIAQARFGGMMLSKREMQNAVANGIALAADSNDLFNTQDIVRAVEKHAGGETTVEFRDQDRYRTARR